jgi:hypothetical protein
LFDLRVPRAGRYVPPSLTVSTLAVSLCHTVATGIPSQ